MAVVRLVRGCCLQVVQSSLGLIPTLITATSFTEKLQHESKRMQDHKKRGWHNPEQEAKSFTRSNFHPRADSMFFK
jgi:hypothetical protein